LRQMAQRDICLVISHADDPHVMAVLERFRYLDTGMQPMVLDAATLAVGSGLALDPLGQGPQGHGWLALGPPLPQMYGNDAAQWASQRRGSEQTISLDSIHAVWRRRPRPAVIQARMNDDWRRYVQTTCASVLRGLIETLADKACIVNRPASEWRADNKTLQLHTALKSGLRVPDSLVTHDADAAADFLRSHHQEGREVVIKLAEPVWGFHQSTQVIDSLDGDLRESLAVCPTMFQERVTGADVRVVVVDRCVFAMEEVASTREGREDIRRDPDPTRRAVDLSEAERQAILRLQDDFGLAMASYDFKRDDEGSLWFLECNPNGQWLWVEIEGKLPISDALAHLLAYGRVGPQVELGKPFDASVLEKLEGESLMDAYRRAEPVSTFLQ
jgi:RimK-like ATP-grasp domain